MKQSEEPKNVPFLTRHEIERRAKEILREHGLESIPVNPVTLAKRLGMSVNNAKFSDDSVAGMIARRGDSVTLLVNQTDPPFRKRFTIAHELGHHFLHLLGDGEFVDGEGNMFRQPKGDPDSWTAEQRQEYQANMFAAALLMPDESVQAVWAQDGSLEHVARKFNVSQQAMGIRLDQLGLLDEQKA